MLIKHKFKLTHCKEQSSKIVIELQNNRTISIPDKNNQIDLDTLETYLQDKTGTLIETNTIIKSVYYYNSVGSKFKISWTY
jgi:hypothetical protein